MLLSKLFESFSEVFIDYDMGDDYDMYDLADQAEKLAKNSSINILRNKELSMVLIDDKHNTVVGALWTSWDGEEYSFDVVVDEKYRSTRLGHRLIKSGLNEYKSYTMDMDVKLNLHVTNKFLPAVLQKHYGLKIVEKHPDGTVSMSY